MWLYEIGGKSVMLWNVMCRSCEGGLHGRLCNVKGFRVQERNVMECYVRG